MVRTSRCGNTHRKPSSSSYREISQSSILVSTNIIWWWEWFTVTTQKTLFCRKTSLVHFKGLKPTINLELFIMPLVAHKLGKWSRQEKWIAPLWKAWDHCLRSQWVRPSSYIPKNAAEYESGPEVCLLAKGCIENFLLPFFWQFCALWDFYPCSNFTSWQSTVQKFLYLWWVWQWHGCPLCNFSQHTEHHTSILNATQIYWIPNLEHLNRSTSLYTSMIPCT